MSTITYGLANEAHHGYLPKIRGIATRPEIVRVCDIGAGAKPCLDTDEVAEMGLDYTILDISTEELAKAPDGYKTVVADAAAPDLDLGVTFDLVITKMLAEHVGDAERFHSNIYDLLEPGGIAIHLFPTLYYPWFVVNRLMPETLSERVLLALKPKRTKAGRFAKFPATYQWCRGPSASQIGRFHGLGFSVEEYSGYFGSSYLERVPPLHKVEMAVAQKLVDRQVPQMTSFSVVVLRKPIDAA